MRPLILSAALLALVSGCKNEQGFNDRFSTRGGPASAPFAIAEPSALAHIDVPIELDGSASYDPDDDLDRFDLDYTWTVVSAPEDANFLIEAPKTANPSFTTDTMGIYEIELVVTDIDDIESTNPAGVIVEVVPWTDLELTLNWNTLDVDLDLHLLAMDDEYEGEWFAEEDCYFGNPEPDWGIEGNLLDNPSFARDDEGDYLEEVITLQAPAVRSYGIAVHYFEDGDAELPETTPTITLTAEGMPVLEIEGKAMRNEGSVQVFGILDWSDLFWVQERTLTTHEALGGPNVNKRLY